MKWFIDRRQNIILGYVRENCGIKLKLISWYKWNLYDRFVMDVMWPRALCLIGGVSRKVGGALVNQEVGYPWESQDNSMVSGKINLKDI